MLSKILNSNSSVLNRIFDGLNFSLGKDILQYSEHLKHTDKIRLKSKISQKVKKNTDHVLIRNYNKLPKKIKQRYFTSTFFSDKITSIYIQKHSIYNKITNYNNRKPEQNNTRKKLIKTRDKQNRLHRSSNITNSSIGNTNKQESTIIQPSQSSNVQQSR